MNSQGGFAGTADQMAELKADLVRGLALTIPSERQRLHWIIADLERELQQAREDRDAYRSYWLNICTDLQRMHDRVGELTATVARVTFLRMEQ